MTRVVESGRARPASVAETATPAPETGASGQVYLSVIVPVTERPEPLAEIYREYAPPLKSLGRELEFVFLVEPWTQQLAEPLKDLIDSGEPVTVLEVGRTVGEAALLRLAAERCRGRIVLTLPAYHRVEARSIPSLVECVEGGADLAVARRWPRRDSWFNRLQNRVFHALLGRLAGSRIHDIACGVMAMRREVLQQIPLYGDVFRFLPALAIREGFRVVEIDCAHHPKDQATRVYSPGTYLRRLIDVLGIFFLVRFTYKPLRFFGLIGSGFSAVGFTILGVLFLQRLAGQGIADRPLLLFGVLMLTLGVQAIALGLIGEIIVHLNASTGRRYRVLEASVEEEAHPVPSDD